MFHTKVGYSQNPDAFAAGAEAAKMAQLTDAKVGLLFTSCVLDQSKVMEGIASVGSAPVLGCTSSAAICTHDGYLNAETGYVGLMTFGGDVAVGVAAHAKSAGESAREIGRDLARKAMSEIEPKKPAYFFMSASPAEEEDYILGIQDIIGAVPVFGGSAADNTVEGKWSVLGEGKAFPDGCSIALFATESEFANIYTGQYQETDHVGIITEVKDDRTLITINGKPALQQYCEWTGKSGEAVEGGNLLTATIFDPLGVKDITGRCTAVRHPMASNPDGSMNIGARLAKKTACIHLHMDNEDMVDANPKTIRELDERFGESDSFFLVHCGGRRLGLQLVGLEDKIYPAVKEVTKDREFLMVFTFGEYGVGDHSGNIVGGLSLSYSGFKND